MVRTLLFDFSRTLLFPKDKTYKGELNASYRKFMVDPNFDFLSNYELNDELLVFLANLKVKYKLYIFTSGTIQNAPEIKDKIMEVFDGIFSAEEMMISKTDTEAYKKIADLLNLLPTDILFIDDLLPNIQAATDAGLTAIQYKDNKSLMKFIDNLE